MDGTSMQAHPARNRPEKQRVISDLSSSLSPGPDFPSSDIDENNILLVLLPVWKHPSLILAAGPFVLLRSSSAERTRSTVYIDPVPTSTRPITSRSLSIYTQTQQSRFHSVKQDGAGRHVPLFLPIYLMSTWRVISLCWNGQHSFGTPTMHFTPPSVRVLF